MPCRVGLGPFPVAVAVGQVGQVTGLAGGGDQPVPGGQGGLGDLAAEPRVPVREEDLSMVLPLAELYASDPALAQACVDLTPRLRRTAEILLAGLIPSRDPA